MTIKVLGSGCTNCKTLERRTLEALDELRVRADVEKVQDVKEIASFGLMHTPGLVIDGKVVSQGGVPSVEILKEIIAREFAAAQS
ncbi:MAG TPA: thioredoxin family protein [Bacteroidota bacterium]